MQVLKPSITWPTNPLNCSLFSQVSNCSTLPLCPYFVPFLPHILFPSNHSKPVTISWTQYVFSYQSVFAPVSPSSWNSITNSFPLITYRSGILEKLLFTCLDSNWFFLDGPPPLHNYPDRAIPPSSVHLSTRYRWLFTPICKFVLPHLSEGLLYVQHKESIQ